MIFSHERWFIVFAIFMVAGFEGLSDVGKRHPGACLSPRGWDVMTQRRGLKRLNWYRFEISVLFCVLFLLLSVVYAWCREDTPKFKAVADDTGMEDGLLHPANEDGKWGYINARGQWVVPPVFGYVKPVSDTTAWCVAKPGHFVLSLNGYWFPGFRRYELISREGIRLSPRNAAIIYPPSEGMAVAVKSIGLGLYYSNGRMGFVDVSGNWAVSPRYRLAGSFSEGLAWVCTEDRRYGYIDASGDWVIQPQFNDASDFREGKAIVGIGSKKFITNKEGALTALPDDSYGVCDFHEGLARANIKKGGVGFLDIEGNWVFQFPEATGYTVPEGKFSDGLAMIYINGMSGYVNRLGDWVIAPKFKHARNFSEGLASARNEDGLAGYIDTKGDWVIPPQFKTAGDFKGGIAPVDFQYDATGSEIIDIGKYIDRKGNIIWTQR